MERVCVDGSIDHRGWFLNLSKSLTMKSPVKENFLQHDSPDLDELSPHTESVFWFVVSTPGNAWISSGTMVLQTVNSRSVFTPFWQRGPDFFFQLQLQLYDNSVMKNTNMGER